MQDKSEPSVLDGNLNEALDLKYLTVLIVMDAYVDEQDDEQGQPEDVADVLQRYAHLVIHEELRSKFVSKEGYKIIKTKESLKEKYKGKNGCKRSVKIQQLLNESSFAKSIQSLFAALAERKPATLKINNWIPLSINEPSAKHQIQRVNP